MFTLKERIAVGGMAEVYRVEVTDPGGTPRILALKKILPEPSEEKPFVRALLREARIASLLDHPNIVRVYEVGEIEESPFLLMDYVEGTDLAALLAWFGRRRERMPLEISLYVMREVARGLAYAHAKTDERGVALGIVHRDVTPPNILLSAAGEVKLTDFGIAKAASNTTKTPFGTLKGKLLYMSPEQLRGEEPDPRSDIFSLGVVAHEMFTGWRPFEGKTEVEIIDRLRRFEVDFEGERWKGVPAPVVSLIRRAMAPAREDRFQGAGLVEEFFVGLPEELRMDDGNEALRRVVAVARRDRLKAGESSLRPETLRTKKLRMETVVQDEERTAILTSVPDKVRKFWSIRWVLGLIGFVGVLSFVSKTLVETLFPQDPIPLARPEQSRRKGGGEGDGDRSGALTLPPAPSPQGRGSDTPTPFFGSLTIVAQPWGRVSVKGLIEDRISPVTIVEVDPGSYRLLVAYDPQKEATVVKKVRADVRIAPGQKTLCNVNFSDPVPRLRCR